MCCLRVFTVFRISESIFIAIPVGLVSSVTQFITILIPAVATLQGSYNHRQSTIVLTAYHIRNIQKKILKKSTFSESSGSQRRHFSGFLKWNLRIWGFNMEERGSSKSRHFEDRGFEIFFLYLSHVTALTEDRLLAMRIKWLHLWVPCWKGVKVVGGGFRCRCCSFIRYCVLYEFD